MHDAVARDDGHFSTLFITFCYIAAPVGAVPVDADTPTLVLGYAVAVPFVSRHNVVSVVHTQGRGQNIVANRPHGRTQFLKHRRLQCMNTLKIL